MRVFAYLPSKRRVAGVIAFALMILGAFTAVHHHPLAVPAHETAFATAFAEHDNSRTSDCFVCRTLVSARELIPQVSAPHVVVADTPDTPAAPPALADVFRPSAPRAPPAA